MSTVMTVTPGLLSSEGPVLRTFHELLIKMCRESRTRVPWLRDYRGDYKINRKLGFMKKFRDPLLVKLKT